MIELAKLVNDNQKAPRNIYLVLLLVFVCRVYINLKMSSFCERPAIFQDMPITERYQLLHYFFLYFYMQTHKQKVYFKMCPHFVSSYDIKVKIKNKKNEYIL